jgi:gas vesicle protein
MEENELRRMAEKYAEQMARMAAEAGRAFDRAMGAMESNAKQMYEDIRREAGPHAEEMKRMAKDIMGDVKSDMPRVRADLQAMEARAKQKLKDLRGKQP